MTGNRVNRFLGKAVDKWKKNDKWRNRRSSSENKESSAVGLTDPSPIVRKHSAEALKNRGTAEDLTALHEANVKETDLGCKIEILRAIVALERRFLLKSAKKKAV